MLRGVNHPPHRARVVDPDQRFRKIVLAAARGRAQSLRHKSSLDRPATSPEGSMRTLVLAWAAIGCIALPASVAAQSVDVGAAEALTKKSGCMKCHSVSAKKEGPPFKDTAAKYKGKPDAVTALTKHLTTNPKIKVDGKEELHDALKTKNEAEIKNVVAYILSR
jgi:cytochrome c